jgi:hypothetical protein
VHTGLDYACQKKNRVLERKDVNAPSSQGQNCPLQVKKARTERNRRIARFLLPPTSPHPHRPTPEAAAAPALGGDDSGPPRRAPRRSARWWWPRSKWQSTASTPSSPTTTASSRRRPFLRTATSKPPPSAIVLLTQHDAKTMGFNAILVWFWVNFS